jgi:hypothetical protein
MRIGVAGHRQPAARSAGQDNANRRHARSFDSVSWAARTQRSFAFDRAGSAQSSEASHGSLRPLPLGHRELESTVRDLGIEVDDAPALSEQIEI